ncbi:MULTISPECIES: hypothetical protein [Gordonia]|jgi:hypothetical protein|uniref:Repressor n=1 Tax=Gordonia alkanivorans CGMCC 6845 TaxID=1423140 RepID=W9DLL8_9ACTN|nr:MULTISPECIES: hypothetical protein [Gordonia]ETA08165.1 repressor [Gordonia alkanivorans CGMCC 6845]MDH3006071.1 XRE family transcriptional regulator [Gordonia alkanivorans]MDH3011392.1 XRE family transcriptional regulator [Gordonia alkanivorans]MDH3015826.1 XRE family transcriptional regulator [Gordonia alkanivorans]MDH3020720.1 XRE family transcriptional regulator [Gordonia alkanivorans]
MDQPSTTSDRELSKEVIEDLKSKGYNQTQIAEMYGVTRQAVSWHLKTYGGKKSTRQLINDCWPWETSKGHDKAIPYRRLRDHGEYMATFGAGMNADKLDRLRVWWRKLEREAVVVEFDPNIPPTKGICAHGGFAYRQRDDSDGNLLIRVNEYTNLTDEGRKVWCRPPAGALETS